MWESKQVNVVHYNGSVVLEYHSIPKIDWESFRGRREEKWRSFQGWESLRALIGMCRWIGSPFSRLDLL